MTTVSVLLGSFGICTRDPGALLTVTSSVSVSLPSSWEGDVTAASLSNEVKQGTLWIARSGRCRLEVFHDATEEDSQILLESVQERVFQQLALAVEQCPLWTDLGLNLTRTYTHDSSSFGPQRHTSFLIQHPDLNSELLSPQDVPCARLRALSCVVSIQPKLNDSKKRKRGSEKQELNGNRTKTQKRQTQNQIGQLRVTESGPQAMRSSYVDARDGFEQLISTPVYDGADISRLMTCALYALVGIKKQMVGVKLIGKMPSPTLIEVAPAVWSAPYLEAMAARARFVPTITNVLGSLANAESPRLRRKVFDLLATPVSPAEHAPDNTKKEIRRRLEVLLQRHISFSPVVKKRDTRQRNSRPNTSGTKLEEDSIGCEDDIKAPDALHDGNDIHFFQRQGDYLSFDQPPLSQRTLEDVANDMNTLHDEMTTILGLNPDEFSLHDTWKSSQDLEGDHEGDSFQDGEMVFTKPRKPQMEDFEGQNDSQTAHSGVHIHDPHEMEFLAPGVDFEEWSNEERQLLQMQNCSRDYQGHRCFNDTLGSYENVESSHESWAPYDLTITQPSSTLQHLNPEEPMISREVDFFDQGSLCGDNLLLYESFNY